MGKIKENRGNYEMLKTDIDTFQQNLLQKTHHEYTMSFLTDGCQQPALVADKD